MTRLMLGAALFSAAAACWAQGYDPKIAFTSYQGNADNLYLANEDGSNPVSIYRANKVRLDAIDMAPVNVATPGAGRIAFSQSGVLKILTYQVSAGGITATGLTTLDAAGAPYEGANDPDFSPDGSKILYTRKTGGIPTEIRLIPAAGGTPKVLWTAASAASQYIKQPRWLDASEFAFIRGGGLAYSTDVQLASLDASDNVVSPTTTLFTSADSFFSSNGLGGFEDFDVARTRASLLITVTAGAGNYRAFVEYNRLDGSFLRRVSDNGWRGHFTSSDAYILYLHGSTRTFNVYDYVYRFDTNPPNNTIQLTSKSQFGYADSRP